MTRRARIVVGSVGVLAGVAFTTLAQAPPQPATAGAIEADAALVLSGDVDYLRVRHASALVRGGQVRAIVLTGSGVGGDSAEDMKREALASGVPAAAIVLETASTSTRENVLFAAPIVRAQGWRRIALVTNESHLPRALGIARKVMPDVEWIPAPVPDAGSPGRARRLRLEETLKLLVYKARGWA